MLFSLSHGQHALAAAEAAVASPAPLVEGVKRHKARVAVLAAQTARRRGERDADFARGWAAGLAAAAFRLESAVRVHEKDGEVEQSALLLPHARAVRALARQ